ncbi:MAG: hypothetical protein ACE5HN_00030 [Nitrospiria bacterium]
MPGGAEFDEEPEDQEREEAAGELFSEEERDLLVGRLASRSIPTREIVRTTAASGRTVARIMQRWGIRRKEPEGVSLHCRGYSRQLAGILGGYYALEEVTLDSLDRLAGENGLSLKNLFDLIREHVSPSRWAVRTCLACSQLAVTSSSAGRYCPACKKKVRKDRRGMEEGVIYE